MLRSALVLVGLVLSFACIAGAGSVPKLDRTWKKYKDRSLGFCVSYPARWMRGEGSDGTGVYFAASAHSNEVPAGEIDVAVLKDQFPPATDYVELHLAGLRQFERAQKIELLGSAAFTLAGMRAVFNKTRYFDPLEKASWVDELIVAGQGSTLYRLQLECRDQDLTRFEAVFHRLVASFVPECTHAKPVRHPED